ncbi:MAG: hypothetical protein PHN31_01620 [Candidatus Gracilibacteria bacterium]|nr:hypothetical protein [Candidatus Gracilibacteria bacterium]
MKYIDISKKLEKLKVFGVEDLKILDNNYDKSKISKWKDLGYINSIIKGFYVYGNLDINQNILYFISNKIYSPSYISLESALNYYGIIPEQTYSIIGVSTNKTIDFKTQFGLFSYKKIKTEFFWGYKIVSIQDTKYLIAELEKALIDYFYLKPTIKNINDIEGLRWNKELLKEKLDFKKLEKYTNTINSKTISRKINLLLKYINNDTNSIY